VEKEKRKSEVGKKLWPAGAVTNGRKYVMPCFGVKGGILYPSRITASGKGRGSQKGTQRKRPGSAGRQVVVKGSELDHVGVDSIQSKTSESRGKKS